MTSPLWTSSEIAVATRGQRVRPFRCRPGSRSTRREVGPGDLFVALKGEATDGHRFIGQAFVQGAAGAIVSQPVDGPHIHRARHRHARSMRSASASRQRNSRPGSVGVTGSVGKTSVKEAFFAAFDRAVPGKAHRSLKSYNNHVGVPLSLARMPRDDALRRVRNGHESCRRAYRADASGAPACRARDDRGARAWRFLRR